MDVPTPPDTGPRVLIVGGLLSPPVAYRRMRRRLLACGARGVDVAPVSALDWGRAGLVGFGSLQHTVARAIARTWTRSGGSPIVVVGHSGGGLLARLAMTGAPYRGQVGGMAAKVGCLVTLGSPHGLHHAPLRGVHEGVRLAAFLARHDTGLHARVATVTVASDAVPPRPGRVIPPRRPVARLQHAFFQRITGPTLAPGSDGIVSVSLAHLDRACQLTFHDTLHGVLGGPWYGDSAIIARWWPVALQEWRTATGAADRAP